MNLAPASSSGGFMGIGRNINHERLDDLRRGRGPVQEHVIDEFVAGHNLHSLEELGDLLTR